MININSYAITCQMYQFLSVRGEHSFRYMTDAIFIDINKSFIDINIIWHRQPYLLISINELLISIIPLLISINELLISINTVDGTVFIDINNSFIDINK